MFEKGKSGNPNGRPKGATNKTTDEIKQAYVKLLENKLPEMEDWITRIAKRSPEKALDLLIRISERFVPVLKRTEMTGADGEDLFKNIEFKFNKLKNKEDE